MFYFLVFAFSIFLFYLFPLSVLLSPFLASFISPSLLFLPLFLFHYSFILLIFLFSFFIILSLSALSSNIASISLYTFIFFIITSFHFSFSLYIYFTHFSISLSFSPSSHYHLTSLLFLCTLFSSSLYSLHLQSHLTLLFSFIVVNFSCLLFTEFSFLCIIL